MDLIVMGASVHSSLFGGAPVLGPDIERVVRNAPCPVLSVPSGRVTPEQALALHFTMNYVVTKGLLAVVVAMIVLSCGTLATLLLVIFNRRVTLKQINYSLAQISEQLRRLDRPAS